MNALTEFLFPAPAKRTTTSIIGWWEKRRLAYNVMVGGAGLVSLGIATAVSALPPISFVIPFPWMGILIFGGMANLCYLMGPAVEILVEKLSGGSILPTGPVLYRMGLTFSVGLALFPALLMVIVWVVRIAFSLF